MFSAFHLSACAVVAAEPFNCQKPFLWEGFVTPIHAVLVALNVLARKGNFGGYQSHSIVKTIIVGGVCNPDSCRKLNGSGCCRLPSCRSGGVFAWVFLQI